MRRGRSPGLHLSAIAALGMTIFFGTLFYAYWPQNPCASQDAEVCAPVLYSPASFAVVASTALGLSVCVCIGAVMATKLVRSLVANHPSGRAPSA